VTYDNSTENSFFEFVDDKILLLRITNMFKQILKKLSSFSLSKTKEIDLNDLDRQDLSRFSEQDIILESSDQIQEYLPEVLGQALARTWIDKRFLEAFQNYPLEIMERGGVYLPDHISIEFLKEKKSRPKVVVYENSDKVKRKLLELKLIMVAEE
tara:strand:- start:901 stop:1365 length:465 start_codon:yes stop_codon:yes gene_type:complete